MHKSKNKWLCVDCGANTKGYEHYFVYNHVWFGLAKMGENGMLCVGCLEDRIGRPLYSGDFPPVHINNPKLNPMSDRLRSRLEKVFA